MSLRDPRRTRRLVRVSLDRLVEKFAQGAAECMSHLVHIIVDSHWASDRHANCPPPGEVADVVRQDPMSTEHDHRDEGYLSCARHPHRAVLQLLVPESLMMLQDRVIGEAQQYRALPEKQADLE